MSKDNPATNATRLTRLMVTESDDQTYFVAADALYAGAITNSDQIAHNTTQIQNAINNAATYGVEVKLPAGHYMFNKLYFHYDATNNPGFPNLQGKRGKIIFRGAGKMQIANITGGVASYVGTVLESADTTGPAINIDGTGLATQITDLRIENMSILATNTTWVISTYQMNHFSGFDRLFIKQKGTGGGVEVEDVWVSTFNDLFIQGPPAYGIVGTTGQGLYVHSTNIGGGNNIFKNVNAVGWKNGIDIGTWPYSGTAEILQTVSMEGCQAGWCSGTGIRVGQGCRNFRWHSSYVEQCQDGTSFNITSITTDNPAVCTITGHTLANFDIVLIEGTGDAAVDDKYWIVYGVSGDTFNISSIDQVNFNGGGLSGAVSTGTMTKMGIGMVVAGTSFRSKIDSSWFGGNDIALMLGRRLNTNTAAGNEGAAKGVVVDNSYFYNSGAFGIITFSGTETYDYLIRNCTFQASTSAYAGAYHIRIQNALHHTLHILNPRYLDASAVLAGNIINEDHCEIYEIEGLRTFNTTVSGTLTTPQLRVTNPHVNPAGSVVAPILFQQNRVTGPLIEFEVPNTPDQNYSVINLTQGDGDVIGPHASNTSNGWAFYGMAQIKVTHAGGSNTVYLPLFEQELV